ncbi:MAG: DUF4296 domain-containing protein [Cloacibacterium sp.]|nr:DUF4296 domain-containing protein [Cloacibacterium sp.]
MKFIIGILILVFISCSKPVDEPENLLNKDKMAEIIADFAIYDQSYVISPNIDLENSTRFVLKKHNIKGSDFKNSYTYYLSSPSSLDDIYDRAQKIILEKDPKMKDFLEKKKKENAQRATEK